MSSGAFHLWNMSEPTPATGWEKQIDELMRRQSASTDLAERKRLFDEVQQLFVTHEPVLYFAARHLYVGLSPRVTSVSPAVDVFPVLWAPDAIAVRR
jgi:peptide/nickel transport system substrate-binding protein